MTNINNVYNVLSSSLIHFSIKCTCKIRVLHCTSTLQWPTCVPTRPYNATMHACNKTQSFITNKQTNTPSLILSTYPITHVTRADRHGVHYDSVNSASPSSARAESVSCTVPALCSGPYTLQIYDKYQQHI